MVMKKPWPDDHLDINWTPPTKTLFLEIKGKPNPSAIQVSYETFKRFSYLQNQMLIDENIPDHIMAYDKEKLEEVRKARVILENLSNELIKSDLSGDKDSKITIKSLYGYKVWVG